jgi:16S rRNA (cytosine1402-N4)-methyltransferase
MKTEAAESAKNHWGHTTVLLHEVIDGLAIEPGDIFLDGTLGSGGHSEEVLKRFGSAVQIIGLDADRDAIARATERLAPYKGNLSFVQENFRNLDIILDHLHIPKVHKILLDVGLSSNQLEASGRGFSFQKNEPLEMTFRQQSNPEDLTAQTIVNEWEEGSIATILESYGDERYARRIAYEIVQARANGPIKTTHELVDIILKATPRAYHHRPIHPATRTFQALRITVNDELRALEEGIRKGFDRLAPKGRMAVISFHSLEDRIVKNFFRSLAKNQEALLITKKPITPGRQEQIENKRARSAKLRIVMKQQ